MFFFARKKPSNKRHTHLHIKSVFSHKTNLKAFFITSESQNNCKLNNQGKI